MKYDSKIVKMPEIVALLVETLKEEYLRCSKNSIKNIVLAKMAQVITAKRVRYKEFENLGFPNYYAINLLPSGFGKDKMVNDIDRHILPHFYEWFQNEAEEYNLRQIGEITAKADEKYQIKEEKLKREYIREKKKKIRNIISETSDGTKEGLYQDAKAIEKADFGSIFVKISELGLYLVNASNDQKLFFGQLNEAYDGKICSKSIKGENRDKNIIDIPVNALLYSDPTFFMNDLKKSFNILLHTGLSRRCMVTFMDNPEPVVNDDVDKAYEIEQKYYRRLNFLQNRFDVLFDKIDKNAVYDLKENAHKRLIAYKIELQNKIDEKNTLLSREISSRYFKALKISCLYACLNHPEKLTIEVEDVEQAIDTVEKLSSDFKKFSEYKPKHNDIYDNIFNFFLEHIEQEFTKTELIGNRNIFNLTRDKFRKDFDDYMEIVGEIAQEKGYFLDTKLINRNSGHKYCLKPLMNSELSENFISLDKLINVTKSS